MLERREAKTLTLKRLSYKCTVLFLNKSESKMQEWKLEFNHVSRKHLERVYEEGIHPRFCCRIKGEIRILEEPNKESSTGAYLIFRESLMKKWFAREILFMVLFSLIHFDFIHHHHACPWYWRAKTSLDIRYTRFSSKRTDCKLISIWLKFALFSLFCLFL